MTVIQRAFDLHYYALATKFATTQDPDLIDFELELDMFNIYHKWLNPFLQDSIYYPWYQQIIDNVLAYWNNIYFVDISDLSVLRQELTERILCRDNMINNKIQKRYEIMAIERHMASIICKCLNIPFAKLNRFLHREKKLINQTI